MHIPILHAPEMQYFRDHPAARLSTPNPAPFKLPRCVPRTAAADGKSNAIRLFLKHKKELDAEASNKNLEKSTGGSLLFPMFPPWGWIWMDAFFSEPNSQKTGKTNWRTWRPGCWGWLLGKGGLRNNYHQLHRHDLGCISDQFYK